MKPRKGKFDWETAGSLAPELEGASRTASHTPRSPLPSAARPKDKNTAHRGEKH